MADNALLDRRRFLGTAAMTFVTAPLGLFCAAAADDRVPRELAAIGRGASWLNSPPLTPAALRGKVVVVNFCTYTCINWLRTLPYVRAWAQKYGDRLMMIGVHTQEFTFEQQIDNVRPALQQMAVTWPIVTDNDFAIWRAFRNNYWPALYFIDPHGKVRDRHFGEGEYERSERIIQRLLTEAGVTSVPQDIVSIAGKGIEAEADWQNLRSPETYVGYHRAERFASPGGLDQDRRRGYLVPGRLSLNQWGLVGEWTIGGQPATLNKGPGRILYRFHARDLHVVLGPPRGKPLPFRVTIDGQPPGSAHGADVDEAGRGMLVEQRLYQLIRQSGPIVDRTFEIAFDEAGAEAFAFTFG